jgi:formylglycine-generating enzyme required for sulfatase activity
MAFETATENFVRFFSDHCVSSVKKIGILKALAKLRDWKDVPENLNVFMTSMEGVEGHGWVVRDAGYTYLVGFTQGEIEDKIVTSCSVVFRPKLGKIDPEPVLKEQFRLKLIVDEIENFQRYRQYNAKIDSDNILISIIESVDEKYKPINLSVSFTSHSKNTEFIGKTTNTIEQKGEEAEIISNRSREIVDARPNLKPDAVAVIIGNKAYQHEDVPAVDFAHNDAEAMKRFVIDALGYRERNIIDLRDATQAQLTSTFGKQGNHKGKLWSFIKAGKSDVTVFYSGHGVPGLEDQRGYLLPVDADPATVDLNGYPVDVLYENLTKMPAKSVTVYLDACFSGQTPKGALVRGTSGLSVEPRPHKASTRLTVLTAARGDQVASWDEEAKQGLFTRYLLEALRGAADGGKFGDGDGMVSVGEVKRFLDEEMSYAAKRRYRRTQTATVMGDEGVQLAAVVAPKPVPAQSPSGRSVGDVFKDCNECPEMVVVAAGEFMMGSTDGEQAWAVSRGAKQESVDREKPRHHVTIDASFAVGRTEVTVGQYRAFSQASGRGAGDGCWGEFDGEWKEDASKSWRDPGFDQTDEHAVVCISWDDARAYVGWLSDVMGKTYRLLSEAEWEYSARANTSTYRYWGDDKKNVEGCKNANVADSPRWDRSYNCGDGYKYTAPSGLYRANGFGLHDTLGGVQEWVEDCWNSNYEDGPDDAGTRTNGNCFQRVLRGGSWKDPPWHLRSADRDRVPYDTRLNIVGFRVARTLSR